MLWWMVFTMCTLTPLVYEVITGSFDVFNPKNAFLSYLFLEIGVSWLAVHLLESSMGFAGLSGSLLPSQYDDAFLCSSIGVLAFHGAYYLGAPVSRLVTVSPAPAVSPRRITIVTAFSFLLGGAAFVQLIASAGGLSQFTEMRQSWRAEGVVGQGYLLFPSTTLVTITALTYILAHCRTRALSKAAAGMGVFALSMVPAVIIGFRSLLLLPVLQLLVVYATLHGPPRTRTVLAIFGMCLIVFTVYGIYRQWSEHVPETASVGDGLETFLAANAEVVFDILLRVRGAEIVGSVMSRVDAVGGHIYFWPALWEALTILVPRSLWLEKPVSLGVEFSERFFGLGGGVSSTVIGELFWHMGWVGVVGGMTVFGVVARALYAWYRSLGSGNLWAALYSFAFVYFAMMAEAIQGYLNSAVMGTVTFLVILLVVRDRSGRTSTEGDTARPGEAI